MDQTMLNTGHFEALGFRVTEATADKVVLDWDIRPDHHQPYGIVHGGVHCAAVESAASIAAALWLGDRGQVVGISNHTDFIRAAREGTLIATATPIHRGRTQQLWLVEIVDASNRLTARGEVRLQNIAPEVLA
jgi:1,4-dihydroxy-2-naphthoyl-CoA hydrolase